VQIERTPGIVDPTVEQVHASPLVKSQVACVGEGDRIDEEALRSSLSGWLQLRGLGLGFCTYGLHPHLDARRAGHSRVGEALKEGAAEASRHSLAAVFGIFPGMIVLGMLRGLFDPNSGRRLARRGKKLLGHPASFALPWPALVGAEYAAPLELAPAGDRLLFDPLLLTEEHDDGRKQRVLFLERPAGVAAQAVPVSRLFELRARFEELSAALALLAASVDSNGSGPFTHWQLRGLSSGWRDGRDAAALDELIVKLGLDLPGEQLVRDAARSLAPYPIAAALDPRPGASNELSLPAAPAGGWSFPIGISHVELALVSEAR
jgi:hypothetical protein